MLGEKSRFFIRNFFKLHPTQILTAPIDSSFDFTSPLYSSIFFTSISNRKIFSKFENCQTLPISAYFVVKTFSKLKIDFKFGFPVEKWFRKHVHQFSYVKPQHKNAGGQKKKKKKKKVFITIVLMSTIASMEVQFVLRYFKHYPSAQLPKLKKRLNSKLFVFMQGKIIFLFSTQQIGDSLSGRGMWCRHTYINTQEYA